MEVAVSTLQNIFSRHERLSVVSAGALMLMAVALMGIVSLMTLNGKATKGYVLNELEAERQALVEDGEITEMLILRASSMHNIESNAATMGMVHPAREDVAYVMPMTAVAQYGR